MLNTQFFETHHEALVQQLREAHYLTPEKHYLGEGIPVETVKWTVVSGNEAAYSMTLGDGRTLTGSRTFQLTNKGWTMTPTNHFSVLMNTLSKIKDAEELLSAMCDDLDGVIAYGKVDGLQNEQELQDKVPALETVREYLMKKTMPALHRAYHKLAQVTDFGPGR